MLALVSLLAVSLALAGCSEWDKYWSKTPLTPKLAPDTAPPSVVVRSPSGPDLAHPTPVAGESVKVVVEADDDRGVARVMVNVDGTPAVQVPGPPWEYRWNTDSLTEASVHRLWATAIDAAGNAGVSDTVYAQVFNSGPQVLLAEPADGARVRGTIQVTANFPGPTPEIESVEFLSGAQPIGSCAAAPWSITLDTGALSPGDHYLSARATTSLGGVGVSPAVRVSVNNGIPSVAIDFPEDGRHIAALGTLILSGTATDAVEGVIPAERLSWRSHLDGLIGTGPYLRIRGLSVGRHIITLTAVNAWGTEQSAMIEVDVDAAPTYSYCRNIYNGIIRSWCLSCHIPGTTEYDDSKLDMTSYAGLMAGGVTHTYESIVPCRPESSLVWNKVTQEIPWVGEAMPPRDTFEPLPESLRNVLKTWILEGAPPDDPEACP